jgi:Zn finger protein HypA/HybF involved in hydrogenase expression
MDEKFQTIEGFEKIKISVKKDYWCFNCFHEFDIHESKVPIKGYVLCPKCHPKEIINDEMDQR